MTRLLCLAVAALLVAPSVSAAGPGGGPGPGFVYVYDASKVETIEGEVVSVEKIRPLAGSGQGMHITVRTGKGALETVHLGPAWFVEAQDISFKPGDRVQVTGSRVESQGSPAIIANTVKKDEETLRLRDEGGVPYWAGPRRR